MPETLTEQSNDLLTRSPEPEPYLAPEASVETEAAIAENGYADFSNIIGEGLHPPPPEIIASILSNPDFSNPANAPHRAKLIIDLQSRYGNDYVQQVVAMVQTAAEPTQLKPAFRKQLPNKWPE